MRLSMPIAARKLPFPITGFGDLTDPLTALHGPDCAFRSIGGWMIFYTPGEDCGCGTCDGFEREAITRLTGESLLLSSRFIVCPDCGNKRCPQAIFHDYACTGSNDTNQVPELKAVREFQERRAREAEENWYDPRHEPRFDGCLHHCRDRKCDDTNWGGRDRVHSRSRECPPPRQDRDPACPDCAEEAG